MTMHAVSPRKKAPAHAALAISAELADHVARFRYDAIPADVRERAKYLILDGLGVAIASTTQDFAKCALPALKALAGSGECSIVGMDQSLPVRDAVLMNGMVVHGIDFDDTHLDGVVHPTASALPCALGVAEHLGLGGEQLLAAYTLGVEI